MDFLTGDDIHMDAKANMIVANGKPITSKIVSCTFDSASQMWIVTFKSGKSFRYNRQNLIWLKNPVRLEPQHYQIHLKSKNFTKVSAIYSFSNGSSEYWHIVFSKGHERDYCKSELQVTKSVFAQEKPKQVFDYLEEVASIVSVHTKDGTSILAKQYQNIDFLGDDTAAAIYLNPSEYHSATDLISSTPIFPFGCNASQFRAVCNALSNRISVIEGPPGTGKTQTILNIVANLVLQGKTVQVVSNNNSAIKNVIEKLSSSQYQLEFIAALLGKKENKETFILSQNGIYPNLEAWDNAAFCSYEQVKKLRNHSLQLHGLFSDNNRLAILKQKLHQIKLEWEHHTIHDSGEQVQIFKRVPCLEKVMMFWQEYQDIQEGRRHANFLYRALRRITMGVDMKSLLKEDSAKVIRSFEALYYTLKSENISREIVSLEKKLKAHKIDEELETFTSMSLDYLRAKLAQRYSYKNPRPLFEYDSLWEDPVSFQKEYPVVLSTTYTARSSLGKNTQFDYVIIDEASQVDVATGLLALSCAKNAVIVGDNQQLPNIVTAQQRTQLQNIFLKYNIPAAYNFTDFSFLKSVCELLDSKIPRVILREHYRCHPLIIGFCNQKFYNNELIIMTQNDSDNAIQLITTVPGSHQRDRINQRQIDVVVKEILPVLDCPYSEVGIIAPYRDQVTLMTSDVGNSEIEIDTVHKFQGREKDTIILTTVDDVVTPFSDNSNLINVAVSRAKEKLIVVASAKEQPVGSNMGDLIGYIRYNTCDVLQSEISSVFDLLYDEYTEYRLEYLKKHKKISEYDSENLMYGLIKDVLCQQPDISLDVVCHQPLNLLLQDTSRLSPEEYRFVKTGLSHLDFLIYNRITKQPLLAIEVDGYNYHKENTKQAERDILKNHILEIYHIPLLRFSTNGSQEREKLSSTLAKIIS